HWMALESAMHGERSKRSFTLATLRRIAAFARPHRRALIAFLVLSVVSAVLAVATPVLAGWVVDAIIKHGSEGRVLFLPGVNAAMTTQMTERSQVLFADLR